MGPKTSFDFRIIELLVIKLLGEEAYGDKIAETITLYRNRTCSPDQVYVSLKRLVEQELIYVDSVIRTKKRGRPMVVYALTRLGSTSLEESLSNIETLVRDISDRKRFKTEE